MNLIERLKHMAETGEGKNEELVAALPTLLELIEAGKQMREYGHAPGVLFFHATQAWDKAIAEIDHGST